MNWSRGGETESQSVNGVAGDNLEKKIQEGHGVYIDQISSVSYIRV